VQNAHAALDVNENQIIVFPSPHLHVELDSKRIAAIIRSISSIVSYYVIVIKRY